MRAGLDGAILSGVSRARGASRPHGVRRRDRIIEAAIELFGEVGYRAAGLRDIAARAGITHPGLLYHFGSKEELLAAVLQHRDEQQESMISAVHMTPEAVLAALYALAEQNTAEVKLVEMFATLSAEATDPNHPAHEYFTCRYADVRRRFTALAQVLVDAGWTRPGLTAEIAATNIIALMDGLQIQWLYDPEAIDMVAQLDCFVRSVVLVSPDLIPERESVALSAAQPVV